LPELLELDDQNNSFLVLEVHDKFRFSTGHIQQFSYNFYFKIFLEFFFWPMQHQQRIKYFFGEQKKNDKLMFSQWKNSCVRERLRER
jgi:hypothetical protein